MSDRRGGTRATARIPFGSSWKKSDDLVGPTGQPVEPGSDYPVEIETEKVEANREGRRIQNKSGQLIQWLGVLGAVVAVVIAVMAMSLYNLNANNTSLTTRIQELENKILIEQDVDKLRRDLTKLERTSSDLKSSVDKMDGTVTKLVPNVNKLEKTFSELEPKVVKVEKTFKTLEPKVEELNGMVVKWESEIQKANDTLVKLEPKVQKLDETVLELEPKVEQMDKTLVELEPKIQKLDKTVLELEPKVKQMDKTLVELEPKVQRLDETVLKLKPKVEKMDETVDKLEPKVEQMDKTVVKLEPKVKKLDETVEKLEDRVKDLEGKVSGTETLTDDVQNLKNKTDKIEERLSNLDDNAWKKLLESNHRINDLELKSGNQSNHIIYLLVLTICLACWSVYSYIQIPLTRNAQVHQLHKVATRPADEEETYRVGSVLDSIQRSHLARQICVISFYSETKAFHMRLVESACTGELSKVERVSSLVTNHETIPKLPRAKVFLVFVDFNERDIILEHPDREIGDLRMTTVQGARKMGGDVFVVYVKDKGSLDLKQDHLFNERLRSITTHPELSVLSGQNRVLTTYDGFTTFQRSHLAKCFMKTLQR